MKFCSVEWCDRRHCAKGYCKKHYYEMKRNGEIRLPRPERCTVAGCERVHYALDLCHLHWRRQRKWGDVGPPGYVRKPGRTDAERIYPRLVEDGYGCWIWQGARAEEGYGHVYVGDHLRGVHRWVYEDLIADIPDGLHLDHLCVNPPCANPWHLDPVTPDENSRRMHARRRNGSQT